MAWSEAPEVLVRSAFNPESTISSVLDVVQQLSPRSSFTIAGGYDFTNFLNKAQSTVSLVDSQQFNGQLGFNRLLTKGSDWIPLCFQDFHFPTSGSGTVTAQIVHVIYGHRVTGRLNFTAGGGPQFVIIHSPLFGESKRISGNGSIALHYIFSPRTNAQNTLYQRFVSPDGFLCGIQYRRNQAFGKSSIWATLESYSRRRLFA